MEYFILILSATLVNNILLAQYLGNCPFCGVSKSVSNAMGMGGAVLFVMALASSITWAVHYYLLVPFNLVYLKTIVFILVIAALVQLVEMFLKKMVPPLYSSLGIFLPLITTNCAVMGVALLCIKNKYDFIHTLIYSLSSALGFFIAITLMAGIRERLDTSPIPKPLRGTAITLITAGIMALAFFGFRGMDSTLTAMLNYG